MKKVKKKINKDSYVYPKKSLNNESQKLQKIKEEIEYEENPLKSHSVLHL